MTTYDDDELAEAALYLAHHQALEAEDPSPEMPGSLERRIVAKGAAQTAELRHSTTNASVLTLVAARAPEALEKSRRGWHDAWLGWAAAAACLGLVVHQLYGLRATGGEQPASRPSASMLLAPPVVQAREAGGALIAELFVDTAVPKATVRVHGLPANLAGEHYRIWVSQGGPEDAVPAGSFSCGEPCADRDFELPTPSDDVQALAPAAVRGLWLTRDKTSDAWSIADPRNVLAEGHAGARPSPVRPRTDP